ncbi:pseudouridine synthase, partial [Basidiobolus meristosporus CBS 931.73]
FCQFVVRKENRDTADVVGDIARMTKLSPKVFSYAGTKDRRGITTQLVTGHHVKAERLLGLNKSMRGVQVGGFKYTPDKIDLGDLSGNRFVITIRELEAESMEMVDRELTALRDRGFINYFGMQRFGARAVPTHVVGKHLLLGNWEKAVDLILMPREGETGTIAEARQQWASTRDPSLVVSLFPKRCVAEVKVLSTLAQNGRRRDFLGAISTIPRNLRLMYVHAYQSFIWNQMVSQRIRMYGSDKPVAGDLVLAERPLEKGGGCVKALTSADLSQYSIYDIVMPLPGFDVEYPENEIGKRYLERLGKDGLDPRGMHRSVKEFSLPGSYRPCVVKPMDTTWELLGYSDPDEDLPAVDHQESMQTPPSLNGSYQALRLSFSLGPSQYATMALREFMKLKTPSE